MSAEANPTSDSYEYVPSEFDSHTEKPANFDRMAWRMERAESVKDWSYILGDHIRWGNKKIAEHVATFNMNAAKDCPNLGTEHCQVPEDKCYAVNRENQYHHTALQFRRRQEFLWDSMDAETWAEAFLLHVGRKRKIEQKSDAILRFSQSGDFRHTGDIIKADRIAEILGEHGIDVYTYSASDYLDWSEAEHFTVNQSNAREEYGDRHYAAIPPELEPEEIEYLDDNAVQCPYEYTDGEIECGTCRLCIDAKGPDVYINQH